MMKCANCKQFITERPESDDNTRGDFCCTRCLVEYKHKQKDPDLIKYDGMYHKITLYDIQCGCFCSKFECGPDNPFDTPGEIVIKTYSNLFHVKCFTEGRDDLKIKKPAFEDSN